MRLLKEINKIEWNRTTHSNLQIMFIIFGRCHSQINFSRLSKAAASMRRILFAKSIDKILIFISRKMHRQPERKINKQFSHSWVLNELKYVELKSKNAQRKKYWKLRMRTNNARKKPSWKYYWNAVSSLRSHSFFSTLCVQKSSSLAS